MTIGEKVRTLRKQKGLSQIELAEIVGMNSNHLSRLERDVVSPSTDILRRVAKALDASTDYLLDETDTNSPEVVIEDKSLTERVRLIDQLDGDDQAAVFRVIDSMLTKKRMRQLLEHQAVS